MTRDDTTIANSIIFRSANKEVLRISKDGIVVPEEVSVDDSAVGVIKALEGYVVEMVKQAVTAEREACAQVAENAPDLLQNSTFDGVAAAIRARRKIHD